MNGTDGPAASGYPDAMSDLGYTFGSFQFLDSMPAEQQVRLLRALVDVIPDAVMAHGPDGELVYWSDGVCALLGYTREEIAKLKPFGWVEPEAMRGAPARLETILHDGNLTFESRAVRKDGTVVPTLVNTRRIDTRMGPLVVAVMRDISSLKTAREQLDFIANHDALTGIANRSSFEQRLNMMAADARRHGDHVSLLYIDLDDFKRVNDTHGYPVGDAVLIAVAHRLMSGVREQDVVARMASDEFLVLLSRASSANDCEIVVERLLTAIAEPITVNDSLVLQVSASCGVACLEETMDLHTLVMKADVAMHAAKRASRGRWLSWSEELKTQQGDDE